MKNTAQSCQFPGLTVLLAMAQKREHEPSIQMLDEAIGDLGDELCRQQLAKEVETLFACREALQHVVDEGYDETIGGADKAIAALEVDTSIPLSIPGE